jgi:hypothetical protein
MLPAMNMVDLLKFLKKMQPKFKKAVSNFVSRYVVRIATFELDRRNMGLSDQTNHLFSFAETKLLDEIKKGWYSIKTEIAIFPLKNKILTIFYGERDFEKIWTKNKEVSFYGFWDNTDRDEKCSSKEWSQRKKDWQSVLVGDGLSGVPAIEGFGFQFTNDNLFTYIWMESSEKMEKRMFKHLPTMEERLYRCAEYMVDKEANLDVNKSMSYFTSNERKTKINEQMEKIRGKLVELPDIASLFKMKVEA